MRKDAKIGLLNFNYSFLSGDHSMHRWADCFREIAGCDMLNYEQAKHYSGDIIICLNGRPDLPEHVPPKEFHGLKLCHVMDSVFQATKAYNALKENKVDFILAYNRHDLYDQFFKTYYKDYINKVIPIPFGFNDYRFHSEVPFSKRINKCVGLGSVNPINDPLCGPDIEDFKTFFKDEPYMHRWRKKLVDNKEQLSTVMDSMFPEPPLTKDFSYDILRAYNNYQMFTTCESLMNYPSVKTFEGMACGTVFVGNKNACYEDIGFRNNANCILHKYEDLNDFKEVIEYYQQNPDTLKVVSENGMQLMKDNFAPDRIAWRLYKKIRILSEHKTTDLAVLIPDNFI